MRARQRMQRANVHCETFLVVEGEGGEEGGGGRERHTLKFFNTLGISSTKETSSTSLLVAPQDMSREKRCERMAWPTWMDIPGASMLVSEKLQVMDGAVECG